MRAALIVNNICVDMIMADPAQIKDGRKWVNGDSGDIGDVWNGTSLVRPTQPTVPPDQLQAAIVAAVQRRLDDFAKLRNYDGILSVCTYAGSAVPQFAAEAAVAMAARDTTWATLYSLLGEINAGTRPVPTGYADIEPLLPALEWPAI